MSMVSMLCCMLLSSAVSSAAKTTRIEAERFPVIVGAKPEKQFADAASGRAYVFLPKGPMKLDQPIKAHMAVDFDMPARMCLINVRYRIESRGSDSFYWRLNDEDWRSFPMRAGVGVRMDAREYFVAFAARNGQLAADALAGRGERAYVCRRAGRVKAFAIENGKRLTCDGQPLMEANAPVTLGWTNGRVAAEAKATTRVQIWIDGAAREIEVGPGRTELDLR